MYFLSLPKFFDLLWPFKLKSHSFESFVVYAKVLLRFQLIFCAFFLWNNDFQFLIFFFIRFLLISGVRYTNEIKSNGSVDRTNSDTIGFKWIIPGTLTRVIISDSILIRSLVLYIWKIPYVSFTNLVVFSLDSSGFTICPERTK